ncbi:hypothetical protein OIU78_024371 [Salix suchowensis]|nr:hypothetical protein OIU78_024371 [Salix suchowensis]
MVLELNEETDRLGTAEEKKEKETDGRKEMTSGLNAGKGRLMGLKKNGSTSDPKREIGGRVARESHVEGQRERARSPRAEVESNRGQESRAQIVKSIPSPRADVESKAGVESSRGQESRAEGLNSIQWKKNKLPVNRSKGKEKIGGESRTI